METIEILSDIINTLFFASMVPSIVLFGLLLWKAIQEDLISMPVILLVISIVILACELPYAIATRLFGASPMPGHEIFALLESIPILMTWRHIVQAILAISAKQKN